MKQVTMLMVLLLLCSCSTRETAKSVAHAQVSSQAIVKTLTADDVITQLQTLDPESQKKVIEAITNVLRLAQSIDISLRPAYMQLASGDQIERPSVDEAIKDLDAYIIATLTQAGKSEQEVAQNERYRSYLDSGIALVFQGSNIAALVSGGLLGGGGLGLTIAKILSMVAQARRAVKDQIDYTKDLEQLPDEDYDQNKKRLKEQHLARQVANGTHKIIATALIERKNSHAS